jgi:hypothetical protein|uniref:Uncharacterized protein n=1 Tax=uncultured virus TaxID=340016 RepID=A0A0A0UXV5_9VIRU|nr:hypothetical protein [uncultured virus]
MKQVLKSTAIFLLAVLAVLLIVWYTVYIWGDCLEENSFFTCARMLNR